MNVTCPSCQTRYAVDDARVPPSGVTIKCPKCAHTFTARREEPERAVTQASVALPGSPPAPNPGADSALPLPGTPAASGPSAGPQQASVPLPSGPKTKPAIPTPSRARRPAVALPSSGPKPQAPPPSVPGLEDDDELDLGLDDNPFPELSAEDQTAIGDVLGSGELDLGSEAAGPDVLDFIDDAASGIDTGDTARPPELRVRRRDGQIEGPYGQSRIVTMLRNRAFAGNEDISEDGLAWRAMVSVPELSAVIDELAAQDPYADLPAPVRGPDDGLGISEDLPALSSTPSHGPSSDLPGLPGQSYGPSSDLPGLPQQSHGPSSDLPGLPAKRSHGPSSDLPGLPSKRSHGPSSDLPGLPEPDNLPGLVGGEAEALDTGELPSLSDPSADLPAPALPKDLPAPASHRDLVDNVQSDGDDFDLGLEDSREYHVDELKPEEDAPQALHDENQESLELDLEAPPSADLDAPPPSQDLESLDLPPGSSDLSSGDLSADLRVADVPNLPPMWETYKKHIIIFSAVMALVLIGVLTHVFTPYGAFGSKFIAQLGKAPPPKPPPPPPPKPAKVVDRKEVATLMACDCFEGYRSVLATLREAKDAESVVTRAKAFGFAHHRYGEEDFPMAELQPLIDGLEALDLSSAYEGNEQRAQVEVLKARAVHATVSEKSKPIVEKLETALARESDDAELGYILGIAKHAAGDAQGAKEAWEGALANNPKYAPALFALAELRAQKKGAKAKTAAASDYLKVLEAEPRHGYAGKKAADLYQKLRLLGHERRALVQAAKAGLEGVAPKLRPEILGRAARSFDEAGRPDEARPFALEAAKLSPGTASYIALAATSQIVDQPSAIKALAYLEKTAAAHAKDAEILMANARALFATEQPAKAFMALDAARKAAPDDYRSLLMRGQFNVALGKLKDARIALKKAMKLGPKVPGPQVALGRLELEQGAVNEALKFAKTAVKADPDSVQAQTLLGDCHVRRKDPGPAKRAYKKAMHIDDESLDGQLGYANVLRDMTRGSAEKKAEALQEALPIYAALLEAHPKNPAVMFEHGRALEIQGKFDEALDLYRRAAALDAADARPHLKIVAAHIERPEPDVGAAEDALNAARATKPEDDGQKALIEFWAGRVAIAGGQPRKAVTHLRKASEAEPKNASFQYWYGMALESTDSLYEAIYAYEKAISLNSRLALAHRALGRAALEQHEYARAIKSFEKYKNVLPDDYTIWVDIGDAYEQQNRDKKAMRAYKKAIKKAPSARALVAMGNILSRRGDEKAALKKFAHATKIDAEHGEAWCQWGISLARGRKIKEKAKKALTRCVDLKSAPDDMKATAQEILDTARAGTH